MFHKSSIMIAVRVTTLAGITVLSWPTARGQQQSSGGTIVGVVHSDAGVPLSGVGVTITVAPPLEGSKNPEAVKPWNGGMTTGADGAFRFGDVPAGSYIVCAQPPSNLDLAGNCVAGTGSTVELAGRQNVTMPSIRLKKAFRLRVRVNDTKGDLAQNEGKTAGAHLAVGVWEGRGFRPMELVKSEGAVREYELALAYDAPVSLSLSSSFYQMQDDKGKPIEERGGARVNIAVAAGTATPGVIVYNIVGKK